MKRKRLKLLESVPEISSRPSVHARQTKEAVSSTIVCDATGTRMINSEDTAPSAPVPLTLAGANMHPDENANEATPNLNAAKLCYQRMHYCGSDVTLNILSEGADVSGIDLKIPAKISADNNNSVQYGKDTSVNGRQDNSSEDSASTQMKKTPAFPNVVGGGSVNTTNAGENSLAIAGNNALAAKTTRSPLATVVYNNYCQNDNKGYQVSSVGTSINNGMTMPHAHLDGVASHSHSPSMPTTSQQAALLKYHHQQAISKQQKINQCDRDEKTLQCERGGVGVDDHCIDHFTTKLSDEMILQIFRCLSKNTLIKCSYVCRRFSRCARDESLWTRLDLGGRSLKAGALESILTRGVVVLRLAQAELHEPIFESDFLTNEPNFLSKLQYLDLSMASITKQSLKILLNRCRQLRKLSLEHIPLNDEICNGIAKNENLETLNLAMCVGLEAWSVRKMMESLSNLNSLNISWTNLSIDAVTSLVTNITSNIIRLNIAGCRKTMFDSHLSSLAKRCPQLLELDLSDCTGLTVNAITILCQFKMLEYLSLSRCYLIPASSYTELSNLPTLTYLDVFGLLSETGLAMLQDNFPSLGINKFIHSSVARPTVGTRRTSIWGLKTRD